jgi:chaperonin GroES
VNLRPLHDRVVVKREPQEQRSAGGILIPDTAGEKPTFGKVIAVGQGKILENGQTRAVDVKVGDRVLFGKYSGTEVKINNEELVVMREDDVMAIVDK